MGANFAVDMCVGSLVVFAWHMMNSVEAELLCLLVSAVASGFIYVLVSLSCQGEASDLHEVLARKLVRWER